MLSQIQNICILGDGGWGTTLAILLHQKGFTVTLWSAFRDYAFFLDKNRVNPKFLPGVRIPKKIIITSDINKAVEKTQVVVLAIPSKYMRLVLRTLKREVAIEEIHKKIFVSVAKGIEIASCKRMSEVVKEELGNVKLAVLSGPTIVKEVSQNLPTSVVIASEDKKLRFLLQDIFMSERFRVYTSDDVIGVELGGALKNIIAISCGIADGLGMGTNAKAALVCRGLVEIARLGVCLGAKRETFSGISGLGDLITTCFSPYSRNRFVGEQIGQNKTLRQILKNMQMVAEGVPTVKAVVSLAKQKNVEMPITKQVYNILYKGVSPVKAVRKLMLRAKKEE
ncbi:MAG: NAD(P)-dependent glycerol-3-phosphate dehydrogenase [Candidatus Omnitrophica bacterium]|nr:NAD(P)-dependent glycerol-3-phosphate dehydrogenase [Candidatus Omnitrophota bacterium]